MLESQPNITKVHRDERKYIIGPNGGKIGIACQEALVTFGSTEMTIEILSSEIGVSKEEYKRMIGNGLTDELKETRPELINFRLWAQKTKLYVMGNNNSNDNKPEIVQKKFEEEERYLASDVDFVGKNYSYHFIKSHLFQSNFSAPIEDRLIQGGCKVLDVACGSGTWLLDLSTNYENSHFSGLDFQAIYPQEIKPPNLDFIKADILDGLPFPDNEFDFVHQDTLTYDLQRNQWDFVLSELIRITKPGGFIEITELYFSYSDLGPILYKLLNGLRMHLKKQMVDTDVMYDLEPMLKSQPHITQVHRDEREIIMGPHGGKLGLALQEVYEIFSSTEKTIEIISSEMEVSKEEYKQMIGKKLTKEISEIGPKFYIFRLWTQKVIN
ncbi:1967_t:CDS:2 [Funneliformis caledonium]|uniref:1967_t:CDS:1 n=1 Tax=Funneliformis caledonium TaxID=1117310 RepID=A0A9N9BQI3_9GLOM|nr:1967_t:CDS:2 [Funneliformis caledonium]